MMSPYKGLPRKPMRKQLRGEAPKAKAVKTNQRRRHGKDLHDGTNNRIRRNQKTNAYL